MSLARSLELTVVESQTADLLSRSDHAMLLEDHQESSKFCSEGN